MTPKKESAQKKYMASIFSTAVFNTRSVIFVEMTQETQTRIPLFLSSGLCTNFPQDTVPISYLKLTGATRVIKSKDILIF